MKKEIKIKQTIPVILASDNNYAPCASISMMSILKNAKSESDFDFYILIPDFFKEEYKQKIEKDCDFYQNKKINFINMGNDFINTKNTIPHVTNQTYYRLKAAQILPEKYDKCIYLDVDTIVLGDLRELFNINLEDNYAAGTYAPAYHFFENPQTYCKKAQLPSLNQYINAGVLLLNLKKIRRNNLTEILCKEALKDYPAQDQDIINKVFYNSIKHIPLKYNLMTKYKSITNKDLKEYEKLCNLFGKDAVEEAINNPFIIHYADKIKPWNNKEAGFSSYWIKYAQQSVFYNEIKSATQEKYEQQTDSEKNIYYNLFSIKNELIKNNNENNFKNFIAFRYDYIDTLNKYEINLGDYVQSFAIIELIKKLYPNTNIITFDRDNLGNYDGASAYSIMHGYFSNSYTFLPNRRITPIYIGTHLSKIARKNIFDFLRFNPGYFDNEIIGCRDKYTQEYFSELKIPNYFSRCMTLTLPKREKTEKQNKIFLVNLQKEIIQNLPSKILDNSQIINQRAIDTDCEDTFYYKTFDIYINKAQELLNKYKNEAKLVITTALHCAAPCAAFGIPVILFRSKNNAQRITALDGIIKIYDFEDLINNKIDFCPKAPEIEDLKKSLIENLDLTIKAKQGLKIDTNKLNKTREFISRYNIL